MDAAAWEVAGDVAEDIEASAEAWFRKKPTKQRFKHWLRWQAATQMFGRQDNKNWLEGITRIRPSGQYETKAGDTLSKIAKAYYGDPSRWDVIYIHNYGSVGDDPDNIQPRITLEIP